jgi:hypothetical protein
MGRALEGHEEEVARTGRSPGGTDECTTLRKVKAATPGPNAALKPPLAQPTGFDASSDPELQRGGVLLDGPRFCLARLSVSRIEKCLGRRVGVVREEAGVGCRIWGR